MTPRTETETPVTEADDQQDEDHEDHEDFEDDPDFDEDDFDGTPFDEIEGVELDIKDFLPDRDQGLADDHRSGFVSFVGRPNVGKSTLLNRILGRKVSIVSDKPQTTRNQIRGVLTRDNAQLVFVDTPGIHKPRTLMGSRLNDTALAATGDVDAVCLLVDATAPIGTGDQWVASHIPPGVIVVVNKIDIASREAVMKQLTKATEFQASEFFPVSAKTGEGVDVLVEHLVSQLPIGPRWYPPEMVTDTEEAFWVAELVREKLLEVTRRELPHSIACRVVEWEWPRIRVEILVERESQKPIVIGKGGLILKTVGTEVRKQLPDGAFIELHVKVDKDWQRRPRSLERLGY